MFNGHLERWHLVADGPPIVTHASHLLPVLQAGAPAMLKIAHEDEERRGPDLMIWWDGDGAARVLAHHGDTVLLERARLLRFVFAYAGLSAAWILGDGDDPVPDLTIAEIAAAEIAKS